MVAAMTVELALFCAFTFVVGWAVAYLPMEVVKAAKLIMQSRCPMCGESKKIFVAKQHNGTLKEEAA
jgi:hypothetical protein